MSSGKSSTGGPYIDFSDLKPSENATPGTPNGRPSRPVGSQFAKYQVWLPLLMLVVCLAIIVVLGNKLSRANNEINRVSQEIETLRKEHDGLQQAHEELGSEAKRLQNENSRLIRRVDTLERANAELDSQITRCRSEGCLRGQ